MTWLSLGALDEPHRCGNPDLSPGFYFQAQWPRLGYGNVRGLDDSNSDTPDAARNAVVRRFYCGCCWDCDLAIWRFDEYFYLWQVFCDGAYNPENNRQLGESEWIRG